MPPRRLNWLPSSGVLHEEERACSAVSLSQGWWHGRNLLTMPHIHATIGRVEDCTAEGEGAVTVMSAQHVYHQIEALQHKVASLQSAATSPAPDGRKASVRTTPKACCASTAWASARLDAVRVSTCCRAKKRCNNIVICGLPSTNEYWRVCCHVSVTFLPYFPYCCVPLSPCLARY